MSELQTKKVIRYRPTFFLTDGTPNYGGGCLDISFTDGQLDLHNNESAVLDALIRAGLSTQDANGFGADIRSLRGIKQQWLAETQLILKMAYSVKVLEDVTFHMPIPIGVWNLEQNDPTSIKLEIGLEVDSSVTITV